nr:MAG TPA: hypothetical protein [Caudoviricetes sp.]
MTAATIFACFMCFVSGGCLMMLVIVSSSCRSWKVLMGLVAYLLVVLALAFKLGGALIL